MPDGGALFLGGAYAVWSAYRPASGCAVDLYPGLAPALTPYSDNARRAAACPPPPYASCRTFPFKPFTQPETVGAECVQQILLQRQPFVVNLSGQQLGA